MGQGVDRTGRLAPGGDRADPGGAARSTPRRSSSQGRARYGWWRPARPATRPTRPISRHGQRSWAVAPEVRRGDEEAHLSFAGAVGPGSGPGPGRTWWWTSAAAPRSSCSATATRVTQPVTGLQVDRVTGPARSALRWTSAVSGMTERHLHSDPPGRRNRRGGGRTSRRPSIGAEPGPPGSAARTLVGAGRFGDDGRRGRPGLDRVRPARIHHARVSRRRSRSCGRARRAMTRDERSGVGVMHPGRVDVIVAGGADPADQIMRRSGSERSSPASTTSWTGSPGPWPDPARSDRPMIPVWIREITRILGHDSVGSVIQTGSWEG